VKKAKRMMSKQVITEIAEIEQRLAELDEMQRRLARPIHMFADDKPPCNDASTQRSCQPS